MKCKTSNKQMKEQNLTNLKNETEVIFSLKINSGFQN